MFCFDQTSPAADSNADTAGMWLVDKDLPQENNRITLSDTKDQLGLLVANVHFDDHSNDIAMRDYAPEKGPQLYRAVGANRTFPTPPYTSTHNLGTNRMSETARDGVVNKNGQTHEIKNLFTSDGSQFATGGAENPALAIRQTDFIAKETVAGSI